MPPTTGSSHAKPPSLRPQCQQEEGEGRGRDRIEVHASPGSVCELLMPSFPESLFSRTIRRNVAEHCPEQDRRCGGTGGGVLAEGQAGAEGGAPSAGPYSHPSRKQRAPWCLGRGRGAGPPQGPASCLEARGGLVASFSASHVPGPGGPRLRLLGVPVSGCQCRALSAIQKMQAGDQRALAGGGPRCAWRRVCHSREPGCRWQWAEHRALGRQ